MKPRATSLVGLSTIRIHWVEYSRPNGFTMIEMALVILVGSIVMSGLLQILSTSTQTRMNQINTESAETMKTAVVIDAIKNRSVSSSCVAGSCNVVFTILGVCVAATPCPSYSASYPLPAAVTASKDFWGNNMTYTRLVTPVSSSTPATTVVFSVKSKGPDATDSTSDDITYSVTAAEFIARVSRTGL